MSESKYPRVWLFDQNRRVYTKASPGQLYSGSQIIYREHWVERKITGENRASWITEHGQKVSKKGGHGIAFSEKEVDDDVYIHDNRHKIARRVGDLKDATVLRAIEDILQNGLPMNY